MDNLSALFDLIAVLARHRYQLAEKHFVKLGIIHTEARLLRLLDLEGGKAPQDVLSSMLFVDRSNAGRALKTLEEKGYITRIKDTADKRAYQVHITEEGQKMVAEIIKIGEIMVQSFFGKLTNDEAGIIVNLLNKAVSTNEDNQ